MSAGYAMIRFLLLYMPKYESLVLSSNYSPIFAAEIINDCRYV